MSSTPASKPKFRVPRPRPRSKTARPVRPGSSQAPRCARLRWPLIRPRGELAGAQQLEHFRDRLIEPDKNGAGNNRVPDVQGVEMRHVLNIFADIAVMEAVAGIDPQTHLVRKSRRAPVTGQFIMTLARGGGVGVSPGVQFDALGADAMGRLHLRDLRVDEGADLDFRGMKL